ncbi:hypothetical protein CK203_015849 [Vitis vinifera]|uniref:Uncharacterized protein n=1 Tax=Vitis vinifera TaxID=29760 RepID=A0A438JRH9_VITVI|nr:hypothetical protein CK203_103378 [Vitis vinifera]RVX11564.1 hypothetical protein CK203_015849 [Vitis vinifera]
MNSNGCECLYRVNLGTNMDWFPAEEVAPAMSFIYMFLWVVSALNDTAKHLLEQNAQVFNQITANLSTFKVRYLVP